jgi:hypothetical protein
MTTDPCESSLEKLRTEWHNLRDAQRWRLLAELARNKCEDVVPFLLKQLESDDPFYRTQALADLAEMGQRDLKDTLIDFHQTDPDEDVRLQALIDLGHMFRGEADREVLQLALEAFDDPHSSTEMKVAAGAMMMFQLRIPHDERGGPGWWNGDGEDLDHPSIVRAVNETRELLNQEQN